MCKGVCLHDSLYVEIRLKPEEKLSGNFKESKTRSTYHQTLSLEKPYLKLLNSDGKDAYFTDIGLNLGRQDIS